MSIAVLALDLEYTLIDDTRSGRARPGLRDFLAFCVERFGRIALFTTVQESEARAVLADLAHRGYIPPVLLPRLEYIRWCGEYKDLAFVPNARPDEILFVDDDSGWIRPDQRDRWVPITAWDGGPDSELSRVRSVLEERLGQGC